MVVRKRSWRPFTEARAFVQPLGLKNRAEWQDYCRSGRRPADIPSNPKRVYNAEWRGMGNWIGTGTLTPHDRTYRQFPEARAFVRALGLKNQAEWHDYCRSGRKPDNIPRTPYNIYKAEWHSLGDWLGTGTLGPRVDLHLHVAPTLMAVELAVGNAGKEPVQPRNPPVEFHRPSPQPRLAHEPLHTPPAHPLAGRNERPVDPRTAICLPALLEQPADHAQ
jgi:hypothetical protein